MDHRDATRLLERMQAYACAYPCLQSATPAELGSRATEMVASVLHAETCVLVIATEDGGARVLGSQGAALDRLDENAAADLLRCLADQGQVSAALPWTRLSAGLRGAGDQWGLRSSSTVGVLRGEDPGESAPLGCLLVTPVANAGLVAEEAMVFELLVAMVAAAVVACQDRRKMHDVHRLAEQARLDADAAARAKAEFLASLSHDLRTPLTSIIGYADLLRERVDDEGAVEFVDTIRRNGELLLESLSDILALSRIELGEIELKLQRIPLASLCSRVIHVHQRAAEGKRIALQLILVGELPGSILCDAKRLEKILEQVLANAIKHTDAGGVQMRVRMCEGASDETPRLAFHITDTGSGMSTDQAQHLFTPFYRQDGMRTQPSGAGLGLVISKKMAVLLGGDLSVQTKLGKGCRFTLTVPTGDLVETIMQCGEAMDTSCPEASALPPQSRSGNSRPLAGRRILLVEDGRDNQRLLSFIIRQSGAHVTISDNGEIGRDTALAAKAANDPFDVILMDMQMPVMDGYTATRELRAQGYQGPIIALTAHALSGDRELCLEAGCSEFATKPIGKEQLINTIMAYTGQG